MYAMTAAVAPGSVNFGTPALMRSDNSSARELSGLEIEFVSGGILNNIIGGVVGGVVSVGVTVALGGTSFRDLGGAFVTGAAMGALTSGGSAVITAARMLRAGQVGLISGAVYNGAT